MEQENFIDFHITEEQAKSICSYFQKDYTKLEEYEVCELLDIIIDSLIIDEEEK